MKKFVLPLLLSSLLVTLPTSSFATEEEPQSYGSKVGHKFLNGFANIATGVLEIPKSVINTTNESNIVYGVFGGVLKGVINTGGRIVVGVVDLVTAPLPTKPIVYPRYVWDDFDADTTYGDVFRDDFDNDTDEVYTDNTVR
jgi:putative exosortase-associated protein (TIGR04073 family)